MIANHVAHAVKVPRLLALAPQEGSRTTLQMHESKPVLMLVLVMLSNSRMRACSLVRARLQQAQDEQEQIEDVQVQIERRKDVLVGRDAEHVAAAHQQLDVIDQIQ